MKYYKKIDVDHLDEIASDTLTYLKEHKPDIYNRKSDSTFYILDADEFKQHCSKLDLGFKRYNLICNYVAVCVMYNNSHSCIHTDTYAHGDTRINLPILNSIGTTTMFFSGGRFTETVNQKTGLKFVRLTSYDSLQLVDKVEIDQPTVIRVNEPHTVIMNKNNAPRITLTLGFNIDPVFLLDTDQES